MIGRLIPLCLLALALHGQARNPVLRVWRINPQAALTAAPALRAVLPEVHQVTQDARYAYVTSAGLALQSLGVLETNAIDPPQGVRSFTYRFSLNPTKAENPARTPFGVIGALVNGIPLYAPVSATSFRDQNLWHQDPVAQNQPATPLLTSLLAGNGNPSPLIGFAFDGYPIYGPWGLDENGRPRRFRSSWQLRRITHRDRLPDGTELSPTQEGPSVSPVYPLGTFAEDYEYVPGSGDLDEHNGRFARTPEYPDGTYAYFLATTPENRPAWPYLVGPSYYGAISPDELLTAAHATRSLPVAPVLRTLAPLEPAPVTLSVPQTLQAGAPQPLTLALRDPRGHRVRFPERIHERPIHLIAVSTDFATFDHIHPELQPDDTFRVVHTFPRPGDYFLYADFTLPGGVPTVARFRVSVTGKLPAQSRAAPDLSIRFTPPAHPRAGEDLTFRFDLPVTDLQPYLGAWAHVIVISHDARRFIHTHPDDDAGLPAEADPWTHTHTVPGPSPAAITARTGFSRPGRYHLWFQIQRGGEVLTFPYTFTVAPASPQTPKDPLPAGATLIEVSSSGFSPSRVTVRPNEPVRLAFRRKDAENCANEVIFPASGLRRPLPPGRITLVELPPMPVNVEVSFACGMRMYRGAVLARSSESASLIK